MIYINFKKYYPEINIFIIFIFIHIDQLRKIHKHKNASLNIVIMQYKSYADWKQALLNHKGLNTLVEDIIRTVKRHGIDGIQFSNLHPEV